MSLRRRSQQVEFNSNKFSGWKIRTLSFDICQHPKRLFQLKVCKLEIWIVLQLKVCKLEIWFVLHLKNALKSINFILKMGILLNQRLGLQDPHNKQFQKE